MRRPLVRPDAELSDTARGELDVLRRRRRAGGAARPADRSRTTSSACASRCSDVLEVARPAQGGRPARSRAADGGPTCSVGISPLFETIDDLQTRRDDAGRRPRPAAVPLAGGRPRRHAGGHARLLRQQQGRRLPRRQLGAVPGRAGPGGGRRADGHPAAALPRPRRHGRPRRRPQLRRHPRPAAGRGGRGAADHRAGRGHRGQVRRPRPAPAATWRRWSPRRWSRACSTSRAWATTPSPPTRCSTTSPPGPSRPTARWCTRPRASSSGSGRPRRSASSAS